MAQVDYAAMRAAMVASQLRTSDVNDPAVIAAMASVPREDYVPAARRETAYVDRSIPLGDGLFMNPPLATGRLLTVADIEPGDAVLLIGDATGYVAALLDHMGAKVTAVGEATRPALLPKAVEWIKGPAAKGCSKNAPFDVVVVDGAVPEFPASLTAQLADGGRAATGILERGVSRLCSGRKSGGAIGFLRLADMEMSPVAGFAPDSAEFVF